MSTVAISPAEFDYELVQQLRRLTISDLCEEIGDAPEEFQEAIKAGDAATIGRMVLAVRKALAERLAARELMLDVRRVSAKEAARLAFAGEVL